MNHSVMSSGGHLTTSGLPIKEPRGLLVFRIPLGTCTVWLPSKEISSQA